MLPSSLQISIVTYRPDLRILERVLRKLELAIGAARAAGALKSVHLALIDNSEDPVIAQRVFEIGRARFNDAGGHGASAEGVDRAIACLEGWGLLVGRRQ